MPSRVYNNFTAGVQQDDFFTNWANFVEHKNIDGLRDGYWVTLWPKMNKALTTTSAVRWMDFFEQRTPNLDRSIVWGDNGDIYHINSVDDTPAFTMASWGNIIAIQELSVFYFIFYKDDLGSTPIKIGKINRASAWSDTWGDLDETFSTSDVSHVWIPPILELGNFLYVWGASSIERFDVNGTFVWFGFPDSDVMWLSLQGSNIIVYTENWDVFYWDWVGTTYSAVQYLGARISKVTSKWGMTYVATEDGQLYLANGLSFQRVTKPKFSNRMEDNSSYDKRLDFSVNEPNTAQNRSMIVALDDVYMYASDTIPWIYKYGTLIPGMQAWLHKCITQNHAGEQIDYIYDMYFYERTLRRLYIAYKAGTTYWVDYIDLDSLETCTDGYMVSEVFSWGTSLKKKLSKLRRATSNTAWNNYINLYYRVNNQDWILIRNINDAENEIERENISKDATTSAFNQFIDIQLKIEIHNDDGSENAPTLHEIMQDYEAIET